MRRASRSATASPSASPNLALRGDEAWIGGVGVVPAARRQGIAEPLMRALHDEARARGVAQVWLEVIEQNESAFRLYEKLGYDVVREVEVWTLAEDAAPGTAREVPAAEAHARIRELRTTREPWQRADAHACELDDARGLETDAGAAVFRVTGAVAARADRGRRRARAAPHRRARTATVDRPQLPGRRSRGDALRDLGATCGRQREMVLAL